MGKTSLACAHHRWLGITGLGGGDGQMFRVLLRALRAQPLDVLHIERDALGDRQQLLSGGGQPQQTLAAARKRLHAPFASGSLMFLFIR
ncbi:hypothetical protein [Thiohalocapsa marina]|uniref:hypothetical protein n=1 Tax=Thiohalocapsa marina TaxID=424902 RepID=UPI0014790988